MKILYPKTQARMLCIVLGLLVVTNASAASEQNYFAAGMQASVKGDYSKALTLFKKAKKAGLATAALEYNMAVSYYKLGQYEAARKIFSGLTDVPTFEQLAYFNLGLIANKQKDERAAIRWFQRAYRDGSNKNIQNLAAVALKRLNTTPRKTRRTNLNWRGFVFSSVAYDSNVTLLNDSLLGVSNLSDTVLDITASAGRWLKGGLNNGVRMSFSADLQKYATLGANDYGELSARVLRYDRLGDWKIRIGASWDEVFYGGSGYQRIISADVRGRSELAGNNQLRLRYKLSRILATDSIFDYLDGWRHQLRAGVQKRYGRDRVRYYYQLEVNNRADRIGTVNPFISFSPIRHSLRATGWWGLGGQWRTRLDARYRYSRYRDENIELGGITERRVDSQIRLSAQLSRKISRRWEVDVKYAFTDNDSNFDRKIYDRQVYSLGAAWTF